jgi:hypothetical protein
MKIGFFPGCSLEGSSREYNESLQAIAPLLGIELTEVPDWNCCGANAAHSLNHSLALALPARILALAEKAGLDEQRVLAIVLSRWTPSPAERDKVAAAFGVTREQIAWGHKTPIQHIYGSGPA